MADSPNRHSFGQSRSLDLAIRSGNHVSVRSHADYKLFHSREKL